MHVCQYAVLPASGASPHQQMQRPGLESEEREIKSQQSLYERIGGHEPIEASLLRFHGKGLSHAFLKRWFEDIPDTLTCGQLRSFMLIGFGGPDADESAYLRETCQELGSEELTSEAFATMLGLLAESMEELAVVPDVIADVMKNLQSITDEFKVC